MTIIRRKNFKEVPIDQIPLADEYIQCNFARRNPQDVQGNKRGTRLFPGDDTPRVFTRCNLMNCEPPPGSTVRRCNTHMVASSVLDHEDVVTVDGVELARNSYYNSIHYGRWDPLSEAYIDNPAPVVTPVNY